MDYNTAKQLKDAGFPQKEFQFYNGYKGKWPNDMRPCDYPYNPTLSELIEACGYRFAYIAKDISEGYRARADGGDSGYFPSVYGSTPEEAVAKLYLAINNR